ncbi:DUF6868 family protein [Natroniella sp. ANB-PHB2]|uniref:DUF6868 family protein n=1 Tax=Natroniella sp. ANB-PHB2 TaxID=3384444 RepID=UPI0038D383DA
MDLELLRTFFMWCTILNVGLLTLSFPFLILGTDFVYKIHSKWFSMPRETFNMVIYSLIGIYKIFIFIFNLVPWITLTIIK